MNWRFGLDKSSYDQLVTCINIHLTILKTSADFHKNSCNIMQSFSPSLFYKALILKIFSQNS